MDEFEYFCRIANTPPRSPKFSLQMADLHPIHGRLSEPTSPRGHLTYQRPRSHSLFPPSHEQTSSQTPDSSASSSTPTKKSEFRSQSVKEARHVSHKEDKSPENVVFMVSRSSNSRLSPSAILPGRSARGSKSYLSDDCFNVPQTVQEAEEYEDPQRNNPSSTLSCYTRTFHTNDKGNIVSQADEKLSKRRHTDSLTSTKSVNIVPNRRSSSLKIPSDFSPKEAPEFHIHQADTGSNEDSYYSILIIGSKGVGKTSLCRQFLTSKTITDEENEEFGEQYVSICVDRKECLLRIMDVQGENEVDMNDEHLMNVVLQEKCDAYVIVFAVDDYESFLFARHLLQELVKESKRNALFFLVANKSDLERSRQVSKEEAKSLSKSCNTQYTEVSITLNHKVSELLVSLAKHLIQMNRRRLSKWDASVDSQEASKPEGNKSMSRRLSQFFRRRFSISTKSCDDFSNK